jgi:superoxide dismutase, Fe-Mn family
VSSKNACDETQLAARIMMNDRMERRDFIQSVGLLAGAAATASLIDPTAPAFAQNASQTRSKSITYEPKPLSFDPKTINGISEKVLVSHYENNYVGAVKRLTAISAQLADLDFAKGAELRGQWPQARRADRRKFDDSARNLLRRPGGAGTPGGTLGEAITRDFGSFERWRTEFSAMGKAEGGGSGWVILSYSPRDKRLVNQWAADHTTTLAGGRPVLVLDMYEHAYHMDYGAAAARYVAVFMEAIRWDNAIKLYERYSRES